MNSQEHDKDVEEFRRTCEEALEHPVTYDEAKEMLERGRNLYALRVRIQIAILQTTLKRTDFNIW